jgi:hypothetical protein
MRLYSGKGWPEVDEWVEKTFPEQAVLERIIAPKAVEFALLDAGEVVGGAYALLEPSEIVSRPPEIGLQAATPVSCDSRTGGTYIEPQARASKRVLLGYATKGRSERVVRSPSPTNPRPAW